MPRIACTSAPAASADEPLRGTLRTFRVVILDDLLVRTGEWPGRSNPAILNAMTAASAVGLCRRRRLSFERFVWAQSSCVSRAMRAPYGRRAAVVVRATAASQYAIMRSVVYTV